MPPRIPCPIGPGPALSPRRQLQPDPLLELSATCTYSVPLLSCSWLTSLVFYGMRFAQPSPPTRFSRLPTSVPRSKGQRLAFLPVNFGPPFPATRLNSRSFILLRTLVVLKKANPFRIK